MRRFSAVVVLVSFLPASVFAQAPISELRASIANWQPSAELLYRLAQAPPVAAPCDKSRIQGVTDADAQHGSLGWFAGGLGAGVGAGFIGTGVITAIPAFGNPQPKAVPAAVDETCYRDGYKSTAKKKNVLSALLGGALGTVAFVLWYYVASDDDF